jgi:acetyltransferase-like isoleucine patch superfamily enzyme
MIRKLLYLYNKRGKSVTVKGAKIGYDSMFEGKNVIHKGAFFSGSIGYGSYIGSNSVINGTVGRFCSIASNVTVVSGLHPTNTFVSTHPAFFSLLRQNGETFVTHQKFTEQKYVNNESKRIVAIGNDVWIGYGVIILPGITIGDGAILAAGAVITKDVMPYSIVAGVPAKEIRKRFNDEQIEFLLNFKWWDRPIQWIENNVDLFENIQKFMDVHYLNY